MYDVAIIGGGVTGCSIARELSKYKLKVCLLEKNEDVATVSSRANSAIVHAGYDCKPGTLMAKLNVEGNKLYDEICEELEVPLHRNGSLVVAFKEEDINELMHLLEQGKKNAVPGLKLLGKDKVLQLEPNLNPSIVGGLWAPTGAITSPYELTLAMGENAAINGVEFFLNWEVTGIVKNPDESFTLFSRENRIESRFVVNAAGLHSDMIYKMVKKDSEFSIIPRKGEYFLLDRSEGNTVHSVIFQPPSSMGKGVLVTPTVDGNLLVGPNASDQNDKEDTSTTAIGLQEVAILSKKTVPGISLNKVITSFAGLRAISNTGDFIIKEAKDVKGFINVAGICSPGLSSAPALGAYVSNILKEVGLIMNCNPEFNPHRKSICRFREMNWEKRKEKIKENPLYGKIVCRCETVTEAEIIAALQRPIAVSSLDGVKRRTRAGMGRCQGGFCTPKVMDIIKREKKLEMENITKFGKGSWIVCGKIKDFDKEGRS